MKAPEPEPLACRNRDSSYDRLLRRLDQALDMARTRQWLDGQPPGLTELEVSGLSPEDLRLLWRILDTMAEQRAASYRSSALAAHDTQQQQRQHG